VSASGAPNVVSPYHRPFRYDAGVRIYLVRHGDAVPEEEAGSDRDRWLSPRGREAARVLGRLLREQAIAPDVILSSPLPRAVQTAELLAASLDYLGAVTSLRCLEPAAQPRVAVNAIQAAGAVVVVVSHEPAISGIGAFVLGLPSFPQFRTAQCCAIEDGKPTFTARADLGQVLPLFAD
jgi:phosphohistidine phosphatase